MVDIRFARLDETRLLGDPNLSLDAQERERRSRLRFVPDRMRYTLAHALLRQTLSAHADLPPDDWRFETEQAGKPLLSASQFESHGLHFSLSHAGSIAACAVTRLGPVGIDVEPLKNIEDIDSLIPTVLAKDEQQQLDDCDVLERQRRFLTFWTLKEAFVKALGSGLQFPLRQCRFSLNPLLASFDNCAEIDARQWAFDTQLIDKNDIISAALYCEPMRKPVFRYRYSRIDLF